MIKGLGELFMENGHRRSVSVTSMVRVFIIKTMRVSDSRRCEHVSIDECVLHRPNEFILYFTPPRR